MSLNGTVQSPNVSAKGFDTDCVVSGAVAKAMHDAGYVFVVRYLSIGPTEYGGDLTGREAAEILAGGLALMAVQHVHAPGWFPSLELGAYMGADAVMNAQAIGFPAGVSLWLDLEGVAETAAAADIIAYANAWFDEVAAGGFTPGLYVGARCGLSGQQLADLKFEHYWKSESNVPALPGRGYQMVQYLSPGAIQGITIDRDVTNPDAEGGQVCWLAQ